MEERCVRVQIHIPMRRFTQFLTSLSSAEGTRSSARQHNAEFPADVPLYLIALPTSRDPSKLFSRLNQGFQTLRVGCDRRLDPGDTLRLQPNFGADQARLPQPKSGKRRNEKSFKIWKLGGMEISRYRTRQAMIVALPGLAPITRLRRL